MAVDLEKVPAPLVDMSKKAREVATRVGLDGQLARVGLTLDFSISMEDEYRSGLVQRLAERILALATAFDDDGDIDIFGFESKAFYLGTLDLSDYQGGIDRLFAGRRKGGTHYGHAVRTVHGKAFARQGLRRPKRDVPVFNVLLTDGDPNYGTERDAEQAIREASVDPVFFQAMGIGRATTFPFLRGIDKLDGRAVDNVGFFPVPNPDEMDDTTLYNGLLNEFPQYIKDARAAGVLL